MTDQLRAFVTSFKKPEPIKTVAQEIKRINRELKKTKNKY